MLLRLSEFGGIMPARDERGLPANGAREALNVEFDGNQIRALLQHPNPLTTPAVNSAQIIALGNSGSNPTRMMYYKTRDGNEYLLRFDGSTYHAAPGQVNGDTHNRVYFTAYTSSDAAYAAYNDASPPSAGRTLNVLSVTGPSATPLLCGLPTPTNAPTASSVTGADPIGVAMISQGSPAVITTTEAHGFETGDKVKLTMDTSITPPEGEVLGMTELAGKDYEIEVLDDTSFELLSINTTSSKEFLADIQSDSTTVTKRVATDSLEDRVYVYTIVNMFGEESAPSPPSDLVTVLEEDGTVELSTGNLPSYTGYVQPTAVRFYRTLTGADTGTRYLFAKEVAITGSPIAPVTTTDDVEDAGLGEQLSTEDYEQPPRGLKGLVALPNGMLAGYVDKTLYVCEPYQPHAWPRGNRRTTDARITALGVFGSTLVLTTETGVYFGSGSDPSSISLRKSTIDAPCLKPDMLVSIGHGVIYPSYDGLVLVNDEQPRNLTNMIFNKRQWKAVLAGLSNAGWHDGKYYAFSEITNGTSYVFDGLLSEVPLVSTISGDAIRAGCAWPPTDEFLITLPSSGSKAPVTLLNNSIDSYKTAKWVSKLFTFNGYPNFAALQVLADFSLPSGRTRLVPGTIQVNIYPGKYINAVGANQGVWDGEEQTAQSKGAAYITVGSPDPVRLPAITGSREYTIELHFSGNVGNVTDVILAESMEELNNG